MPAYSIESVVQTLRNARLRKGLSQGELAKRLGAPQSRISRVESGAVDLRLSSLIEFARALDLEVTLVPQAKVSAVHSIVRASHIEGPAEDVSSGSQELTRIRQSITKIAARYPELREVAQVQRRVSDMSHFRIPDAYSARLIEVRRALDGFYRSGGNHLGLRMALSEIQALRNELAHGNPAREPEPARPAYSLDDASGG